MLSFLDTERLAVTATNKYARKVESGSATSEDLGEFTFSRGETNTEGQLEVDYTLNGSALAQPIAGTIVLANGQSRATLEIPISTYARNSNSDWDQDVVATITQFRYFDAAGNPSNQHNISIDPTPAVVTVFDSDDPIDSIGSNNVDSVSTGLGRATVTESGVNVDVRSGEVLLGLPGPAGLVFNSRDNAIPVADIYVTLPSDAYGKKLSARLTFGGLQGSVVDLDLTNISGANSPVVHLAVAGSAEVLNRLKTGRHSYELQVTDGQNTKTILGSAEIINTRLDGEGDELGANVRVAGLDRMVYSDGTSGSYFGQGLNTESGISLIRGDNSSAWYSTSTDESNLQELSPALTGIWEESINGDYHYSDAST